MPTTFRSNPTPGSSRWAVRRARWRALGLTDDDMTKPEVAVVNSSSKLRGLGNRGGPGMSLASALVFAIDGAGLGDRVAVVTDGQLSGSVSTGMVVGEVSPEAAAGGPLALVEDGDTVTIDLTRRAVDLEVPAEVLAARRAALPEPLPSGERGWLSVYERLVSPVTDGAVLTPGGAGAAPAGDVATSGGAR